MKQNYSNQPTQNPQLIFNPAQHSRQAEPWEIVAPDAFPDFVQLMNDFNKKLKK